MHKSYTQHRHGCDSAVDKEICPEKGTHTVSPLAFFSSSSEKIVYCKSEVLFMENVLFLTSTDHYLHCISWQTHTNQPKHCHF